MTDRTAASHLLRRLTFGPTAAEVDAATREQPGATLARVLAPAPLPALPDLGPDPIAALPPKASKEARQQARDESVDQVAAATWWWFTRLATGSAAEKLTFFWHGHWATSVQKVRSAPLMLAQQQTLRRYGAGETPPLVRAMLRDPALILWLDGQRNTKEAPNENLAREVMELFTLGVGNYGEADVKAAARVLTGWRVDRATGRARLDERRHDPATVTLLGGTARDVDTLAERLVTHPAHVPFIAGRLWHRYGSTTAPPPAVSGRDVTGMLRRLVAAPAFAAARGHLVKQPVEWLVGAVRQLGVDLAELEPQQRRALLGVLRALNQTPLRPPSVAGWPSGDAWLTTSSATARLKAGQLLTGLAPAAVEALDGADRPDALARLLVVDGWTDRTRAVLDAARDPRQQLALALASPEYAVH